MDKQSLEIARHIYRKPFVREPEPFWDYSKYSGPDNKTRWWLSRGMYADPMVGVYVNQKLITERPRSKRPNHLMVLDPA